MNHGYMYVRFTSELLLCKETIKHCYPFGSIIVCWTAGSGGWIHGCAKILWNQHDSTSTVCYCQVIHCWRYLPLVSVSVCLPLSLSLSSYHLSLLPNIEIHEAILDRNERGREMLSLVENLLEITPTISSVKPFALSYLVGFEATLN